MAPGGLRARAQCFIQLDPFVSRKMLHFQFARSCS